MLIFMILLASQHCKTTLNEKCEIPFSYKGERYDTCLDVDNGGKPWCYTNATALEWRNCNYSTCPEIKGKNTRKKKINEIKSHKTYRN